jgi:hypothetical protein
MPRQLLILFVLTCLTVRPSVAQDTGQQLVVDDPYLELHTGPAQAYPIFYVVDRGERIDVLLRRTDWFKVRGPRGQEGWVSSDQLQATLQLSGDPVELPGYTLEDLALRRWQLGSFYGDFGGANAVSVFAAYSFTENLSVEISYSDILGTFSNSQITNLNIVHLLYPEWRVSPYFILGAGLITTQPKGTIVASDPRADNLAHVGVGVRTYLTRRFVFRAEYNSYVVLTDRDENEEPSEWKVGFSFFF